jgi:hypothetical protein
VTIAVHGMLRHRMKWQHKVTLSSCSECGRRGVAGMLTGMQMRYVDVQLRVGIKTFCNMLNRSGGALEQGSWQLFCALYVM